MTLIALIALIACEPSFQSASGIDYDGGTEDSGWSDDGGSDGGTTTDGGTDTTDGGTDCEMLTWYYDKDGDGFGFSGEYTDVPGIPDSPVVACEPPDNTDSDSWKLDGSDCNDDDFYINPGVLEICGNDIDENCDGDLNVVFAIGDSVSDEELTEMQGWQDDAGCISGYYDGDGDGFGGDHFCVCEHIDGYISEGGDCEDGPHGADIYPGAPGSGNDCDDWKR